MLPIKHTKSSRTTVQKKRKCILANYCCVENKGKLSRELFSLAFYSSKKKKGSFTQPSTYISSTSTDSSLSQEADFMNVQFR